MATYRIVEKKNHLHLHAICDTRDSAERYIAVTVPDHVRRGYYMDKTLTADAFDIVELRL